MRQRAGEKRVAVAQATINQDMDLIKSCSEVKRVAACCSVALSVRNKDRERLRSSPLWI